MKLIPSKLALALVAAWLAVALVAAFIDGLILAWQIAGVVLAAALAADASAGIRIADPASVDRHVAANLALGRWTSVTLRLSRVRRAIRGWVHDAYPPQFDATDMPQPFAVAPGQTATLPYRVRPLARGNHRFGNVALRVDTPLRLWQRGLELGIAERRARLSRFRAHHAIHAARDRSPALADRRAAAKKARRRARLPPAARIPARRHVAADRLESDRARGTPHLARIPGRARPAHRVPGRLRPAHARARGRRRRRRSRAVAFRPRAQRAVAAGIRGAAPGRRGRRADVRPCRPALARTAQVRGHGELPSLRAVRPHAQPRHARLPRRRRATLRAPHASARWS